MREHTETETGPVWTMAICAMFIGLVPYMLVVLNRVLVVVAR
ncbi:hypothetical protein [Naumannella halotolerans]|nr:hypothetical protein [Naumannella halotolerans]